MLYQFIIGICSKVSNHGPVCSCPDGYQGDPLSQCFRSRRGWNDLSDCLFLDVRAMKDIVIIHIISVEVPKFVSIRLSNAFLKLSFELKYHAIRKVWSGFQPVRFFHKKITLRNSEIWSMRVYLQSYSLDVALKCPFRNERQFNIAMKMMHKYIERWKVELSLCLLRLQSARLKVWQG